MIKNNRLELIEEYNANPFCCKQCGVAILHAQSDKPLRETKIRSFCSLSCAATFNNKIPKREKAAYKVLECQECKQHFDQLPNSKGNFSRRKYCNACGRVKRLESLNKNSSLIELRSKNELFATRSSWQSARTSIRQHAWSIVCDAGLEKKCAICGYDKHVEICHRKAVKDFNGNATIGEINSISNLIYLCPNHHWEFDNGFLELKAENGFEPLTSSL